MTTIYTHTATGSVASAENETFRWFWGADSYVFDKAAGRSIYLPVGGYAKTEGLGSDPASAEIVAEARAFYLAVIAENERIALAAKTTAVHADHDDWLTRDMDRADSNN